MSVDLAGADLAGIDFSSADLSGADLAPMSGSATYVFLPQSTGAAVDCRTIDNSTGATTAIDEDLVAPGVQNTVAVSTNPLSATATPNGKFLYVPNEGGEAISAFKIDPPTGHLTSIPGPGGVQNFSTGSTSAPFAIAVDPTSSHLFVALYGINQVGAFSIDSVSGSLTAVPSPSPAPTGPR